MTRKLFLTVTALVMGFGMLLANAGNTFAIEAAIVKIWVKEEGKAKSIYADPPVLSVKKNTIVVWMNGIVDEEIQVIFQEGKTCKDVTVNPNQKQPGFFMDAKNCYVTSFLPYAETSTLRFPEEGTFEYKVENQDGKMKTKGKIVVVP